MTLRKLLAGTSAVRGSSLLVTPRYEQYLRKTPNILVDEKVGEFVKSELTTPQRNRRMTFSASSRGACAREQVFQFTGLKAIPSTNSDLHAIFHQGTFMHLKWQALLLDAGILADVEQSCLWDAYNLSGTIDGIGYIPPEHPLHDPKKKFDQLANTFGWELKSANTRSYQWVCDKGPSENHLLQIHAYMLASGLRTWSLVYESKNDQQWKEFIIDFDQTIADKVEAELMYLNDMVEERELPPILEPCKSKKGQYPKCSFRHVCLDTTSWPERVLKMRRKT